MAGNNNGRKLDRWWVQTIITLILILIGAVGAWTAMRGQVQTNKEHIAEVRTNQQTDHDTVVELKADVKHIRTTVDKIERKLE